MPDPKTILSPDAQGFAYGRIAAFLDDISKLGLPTIILLDWYESPCPERESAWREGLTVLQNMAAERGLALVNLPDLLDPHLDPGEQLRQLKGFGPNIGSGHLNYRGHEVYAKALQDAIAQVQRSATPRRIVQAEGRDR